MNNQLFGFDKIEQSLLNNFNNNKLHHGLLFSGNKGIGKASFVFDFATQIIISSSSSPNDDLKKIQNNSHPDLLIIKKEQKKRDIAIDAVREITQFLSLTSAISKHRVIIIDAIDDLNRNSNNAILKTLEEPPQNVFLFLINHNFEKVLETIKSRCHLVKVLNPNYQNFREILSKNVSEIEEEEIKILGKISDNSIGLALEMHNYNATKLYNKITELLNQNSKKEVFDFAKIISGNEELWDIFEKLIIFYFYNHICAKSNQQNGDKIFIIIDKINNIFLTTKNLNLDKSQSIINIFNIITNSRNEK